MRMAGLHAAFGPGSLRAREHILSRHDSTPQLLSLIVPPVRALCYFLTGLMLAVMSVAGHAGGNVPPTFTPAAPPIVKYYGYTDPYALFATPEAACIQFVTYDAPVVFNSGGWVYDRVVPLNDNLWSCFAGGPLVSTPIALVAVLVMRSCDGLNWRNYAMTCATNTCPANSTGTPAINPTSCTCDDGYAPDTAGTSCVPVDQCQPPDVIDPATGQCVHCTIEALTPLPANDACTQALENLNSTQAQKDAACGTLTQALKDGKACLEGKLSRTPNAANPIPLKITSDIRSVAYQAHLREIWDKMEKLVVLENDPVKRSACAARRAEIAAEKGCDKAGPCKREPNEVCYPESSTQRSHCLVGRPANPSLNDAQHTLGNAFDVKLDYTINPLQAVLGARNPPQTIQQFLNDPNPKDCKLNWGGTFIDNNDPVHFYVP